MDLNEVLTSGCSEDQYAGNPFDIESEVRYYCRKFPCEFTSAKNAILNTTNGHQFIDFLSGAGALNYGHNNEKLKRELLEYIESDGITQSLDLYTRAKRRFLETFHSVILQPRQMSYRVQFTGPTGTNAVEAAMKIARMATGRSTIAAFTNAYHGVSLGALAATGNLGKRRAAGTSLSDVVFFPYDGYFGATADTIYQIETLLSDSSSGIDKPAAFIVETVQGEGGVNAASSDWLWRLAELARRLNILLIVDDIQAGCGRTGTFFSFDSIGIRPDIICMSKSISGYGLPMSIVLIAKHLDIWEPGQHNGTFRGNNLAFVTAAGALNYWRDPQFLMNLTTSCNLLKDWCCSLELRYREKGVRSKGRGMFRGLQFSSPDMAVEISRNAFHRGVIVETCGPDDCVLKLLPPLTIEHKTLIAGLNHIESAIASVIR